MNDFTNHFLGGYYYLPNHHEPNMQPQHRHRYMQHHYPHGIQQHLNAASGYGCGGGASGGNYGIGMGNLGGNVFEAYMPDFGVSVGYLVNEAGGLFDGLHDLFSGLDSFVSDTVHPDANCDNFVESACRDTGNKNQGIQFSDADRYGGRVTMIFPTAANITINDHTLYIDGVCSGISAGIPVFMERVESQPDGSRNLVLELDTSRFKENEVQVVPSSDAVVVHIEHCELIPNGEEIQQIYDIPHGLPQVDPGNGGLVTYFIDGQLTIESPIATGKFDTASK